MPLSSVKLEPSSEMVTGFSAPGTVTEDKTIAANMAIFRNKGRNLALGIGC